jgi:superfamily II DNA/RNA helicase
MKFTELGLDEQLLDAISHFGFENATPIQEKAIPAIIEGRDLIGSAQTGTGKTAAFILPILNELLGKHEHVTSTLIIVPTRELAVQIDQQIQGFAYFTEIDSVPIYGGGDGIGWEQQKKALTTGTDIIVATPGKLISHLNMGYVKFDKVKHLILDEADRMLDMGFNEDIEKIMTYLPKKRQNLMFSATMPPKIRQLAKKTLVDPVEISMSISKPAEGVLQAIYLAYDAQKIKLINLLIKDKPDVQAILIFTSTKKNVFEIVRGLKGHGYTVEGISSDLEQTERENVLMRFKSKRTRVLVATDVLSRGIDIKEINIVINFDAPNDAEDYVHRVGRTARADTTGLALTLVNEDDMYKVERIERLIEMEILRLPMPAELGEAPVWNPKPTDFRRGGRPGKGGGRTGGKGGGKGNKPRGDFRKKK